MVVTQVAQSEQKRSQDIQQIQKELAAVQLALATEQPPSSLVIQISFADPNGRDWTRSITGNLIMATPPPAVYDPFEKVPTQPAEGCS